MTIKPPLNLNPIGLAHVYWPNGAPTKKAPRRGIYGIYRDQEMIYEPKQSFPKDQLQCMR
jgi:hypothetical protein